MASSPRLYRIHRSRLSDRHKYEVYNDTDEILYVVQPTSSEKNKVLSLVELSSHTELVRINHEIQRHHSSYNFSTPNTTDINDGHLGTIQRVHGYCPFHKAFDITTIYGVYAMKDISGSADHEFRLTTGDKTVVNATKDAKSSHLMDVYNVQISDDDAGDIFLLALVTVIWYAQQRVHL